jgi:hypothetical protein
MSRVSQLRRARGRCLALAVAASVAWLPGCSGPDNPTLKDVPKVEATPPTHLSPTKDGRAIQKKGAPPIGSSAVPK